MMTAAERSAAAREISRLYHTQQVGLDEAVRMLVAIQNPEFAQSPADDEDFAIQWLEDSVEFALHGFVGDFGEVEFDLADFPRWSTPAAWNGRCRPRARR